MLTRGIKEDYEKKFGKCIEVQTPTEGVENYIYQNQRVRQVVETNKGFVTTVTIILLDPIKGISLALDDVPEAKYIRSHQAKLEALEELPDGSVVVLTSYENGMMLALKTQGKKVLVAAVIYPKLVQAKLNTHQ
jgi:hypothetical protein